MSIASFGWKQEQDDPVKIDSLELIVAPPLIASAIAMLFIVYLKSKISKMQTGKDIGCEMVDELAAQIKSGSRAFLYEEYRVLSVFVVVLAACLGVFFGTNPVKTLAAPEGDAADGAKAAAVFLLGASLSAIAGWLGMMVATDGNSRTTAACKTSLNAGLTVAFTAGAVMGFTVVGLGLAGVSVALLIATAGQDPQTGNIVLDLLPSFGFGASAIALFARVAGGIYTKAADVGADLVGKVEVGINEDDPHNPAVIADNVGDNVGDVAGMGADLFESYVGSIIACMALAGGDYRYIALPLWLGAAGIIASLVGFFCVSTKEEGKGWDVKLSTLMWALEKGIFAAGGLFLGAAYAVCHLCLGGLEQEALTKIFGCIVLGLVAGALIGKVTEYFTSFDFGPVMSIKDRGITGPATVVIQGLGVGMLSCVPPTVILVACIMACTALAGTYGVAIAAVGMLATLGITLATDAYGPVADNAGGLAELSGLGPEFRNRTDSLDALGNTTAATGKGFAIGSAVLTSLSLLAAFKQQVNPGAGSTVTLSFDVSDSMVLCGVLLGAMLPLLFSALTMLSVGKAAAEIIEEVRRQFRTQTNEHGVTLLEAIKFASELPEGSRLPPHQEVKPDSDRCVAISTRSSIREMIAPGAFAIFIPLAVGLSAGPRCLIGTLAGGIACGCMMAILMSNAGGAWDNSKKLCEKLQLKKTDQGKACVVGDTVGDPFKDTSGPALNILIKLMSMVSLTVAPALKGQEDWAQWELGLIPLVVLILVLIVLVKMDVLTWADPLGKLQTDKEYTGVSTKGGLLDEAAPEPKSPQTSQGKASPGLGPQTVGSMPQSVVL